jgi:hypothetical protein
MDLGNRIHHGQVRAATARERFLSRRSPRRTGGDHEEPLSDPPQAGGSEGELALFHTSNTYSGTSGCIL